MTAANEEAWLSVGRIAEMMGDDENTMIAYEKVLVTVSAVKKFEELLG